MNPILYYTLCGLVTALILLRAYGIYGHKLRSAPVATPRDPNDVSVNITLHTDPANVGTARHELEMLITRLVDEGVISYAESDDFSDDIEGELGQRPAT